MASLIVTAGPGVDSYYPLGRRTMVVGRDEGLPVQLLDPHVSRKHFQVWHRDTTGLFYLLDMKSRHGTYVNGKLTVGETPLCNNDVITAGGTTLLFITRDFPDRDSALAYRKRTGEREETTLVR